MPPVHSAQGTIDRHSPPPTASSSSSDNTDNSDSESSSRGSASEDASTPMAVESAAMDDLQEGAKGAVCVGFVMSVSAYALFLLRRVAGAWQGLRLVYVEHIAVKQSFISPMQLLH